MKNYISELTLLLMYLTSWEEEGLYSDENGKIVNGILKNSWKGYSFDVINELTHNGYLFLSNYKNKSVTLTKDGEKLAIELIDKYLKCLSKENQ